jgi:hypothetical protein
MIRRRAEKITSAARLEQSRLPVRSIRYGHRGGSSTLKAAPVWPARQGMIASDGGDLLPCWRLRILR